MYFHKVLLLALAYVLTITSVSAFTPRRKRYIHQASQDTSSSSLNFAKLHHALEGIDADLVQRQKRTCQVGINSHHCALAYMDSVISAREWLSSGFSPGKRSPRDISPQLQNDVEKELEDLAFKRKAISKLKYLIRKLGAQEAKYIKRTCRVNLGNHCLTESMDRAASQYYWLQSPLSPGRRRRSATARRRHPRLKSTHKLLQNLALQRFKAVQKQPQTA